jgi:signal transduction histidine kinase
VSLLSLIGGRWPGLVAAAMSGAVWLTIELMTNTGYSSLWIPYWNGLVRLMIFCLVSVLISEVAERKRVERALEHQRSILQSILDSLKEGVIVAGHGGELLLMNPAAESLLDVEDAKPATCHELLAASLGNRLGALRIGEDALSRALSGELVPEAELFLHDPATPDRWLRIHGRPWLDPDGRNHGSMVVLSDITASRNLERQIAEVSDREQRRLGEDLHDGLCQHLVSTTFVARMLADKLTGRDLPEARDAARIAELLDESITQAKDVARGLYLVPPEMGGLVSALEELAAQVRTRFPVNFTFTDHSVTPLTEITVMNDLFRIAQEAVSNAVKHAAARNIGVALETTATGSSLRIQDDGRGMSTFGSDERGLGLHMMRYRARIIGAELKIMSTPGAGTLVTCVLPRWPVSVNPPEAKAHAVSA